ncbi:hypothetical protein AAFC00_006729 [Neodothiora populina]|uniref:Sister chromatid cohesion acetyltransferase Eco1 n=1 Tax=Neodothiora populina TaxID=2781224 RepID=A0ABR3PB00_9PEZI
MNTRPHNSRLVTYSRAKRTLLHDDTQSIKRRRVEIVEVHSDDDAGTLPREPDSPEPAVVSSSPRSECLFSDITPLDGQIHASTPASSPPPFTSGVNPPVQQQDLRQEKKRPAADFFLHIHAKSVKKPRQAPMKKPLVQMQLNLGQPFQKRCRTCGMEFVPSNVEDAELHRKFHSQSAEGVFVGKDFLRKAEGWRGVEWTGKDGTDRIVSITRHRKCQSARQQVVPVLNVAQAELGAVDIPTNLLWSLCGTALSSSGDDKEQTSERRIHSKYGSIHDRYKIYLYIHGTRSVGLCLAERIKTAYKVMDEPPEIWNGTSGDSKQNLAEDEKQGHGDGSIERDPDRPIRIGEDADQVQMGISRIWVSSSCRQKGIASAMLDCASRTFCDGTIIPKEEIAFSQPTQSGARLARRWFGVKSGWHVYADCNTITECKDGVWYSRRDDEDDGSTQ